MLASGDAESPQLLPLPLPSEPILKVPHHGSDDPGLPALLQRIRPSVALIGVGARNRFGHPTPATLGALEGAGAEVFRTDLQGELIVTPGSAGEPVVRVWRDG
jgi:competence protein ComEC